MLLSRATDLENSASVLDNCQNPGAPVRLIHENQCVIPFMRKVT